VRTQGLLKQAVVIIVAKQAFDWMRARRRRKRSPVARIAPVGVLAAVGGGLTYLARSGKLGGLMARRGSGSSGPEQGAGREPTSQETGL
jgi:hypothetical protein